GLFRLHDILDEETYDRFTAPYQPGKPTVVAVKIIIINIRSLDESEMTYWADLFIQFKWKDRRLKFPKTSNSSTVILNPEWRNKIWTPDTYFKNSLDGRLDGDIIPYMFLKLSNDSTVLFMARITQLFSCNMDLHYFPHDTQTCSIFMQSLNTIREEMDLIWHPGRSMTIVEYLKLSQFDIINYTCHTCHVHYSTGKYSCLEGRISLKRRSGYYIINIYIPSTLIVLMSMLTFWIPPEAVPARITLGVTSLLTIVTKQYQSSLPSVSYIVALNIWMSTCIGFVFFSLVEYVLVVSLNVEVKSQIISIIGPTKEPPVTQKKTNARQIAWQEKKIKKKFDSKIIDKISRVAFPIFFLMQCIFYGTYYEVFHFTPVNT
ncbi:glycine receptor subunit alpha-2-like, partial [Centruroides sculpturatus]|uniref:glycine receptor subunit alpha-2-like n=1 Tax=Centruroides sculpturatus TaxID=218467 RepID=UPI000C6D3FCE